MVAKKSGSRRDRAIKKGRGKTKVLAVKRLNTGVDFKREGEKSNAWKVETTVTCSKCKKKFVLPFKPRRPDVYCDDCFKKISVPKIKAYNTKKPKKTTQSTHKTTKPKTSSK